MSGSQLLDRPLSRWWCVLGWLAATGVFVGLTQQLGGLSRGDAVESAYSTWAVAHGSSCLYPTGVAHGHPLVAPLYPLISGALSWLAQIGHGVAFPSQSALGPHCSATVTALSRWSSRAGALTSTVELGYFAWVATMAGLIALLRASGRGRCGWEPATLIAAACIPPVFMSVQTSFHPEGFLAMGLVLGGLACVRRGRWVWAGLLCGLAVTSQQFALLAVAPLLVVAPANRRLRFAGAAVGAAAIVAIPLIALTSGRAIGGLTGSGLTLSTGDTLLSDLHFHGTALLVLSRLLPIVCALALAWWAERRFGGIANDPVLLVSLVATSLALRLVFEVNLFGYYFMAVAVLVVTLDVIRRRFRPYVVMWLALVTLVFPPLPLGNDVFTTGLPAWLWQVVLVGAALGLAASPLLSRTGSQRASTTG
jgi:hypothetical protein